MPKVFWMSSKPCTPETPSASDFGLWSLMLGSNRKHTHDVSTRAKQDVMDRAEQPAEAEILKAENSRLISMLEAHGIEWRLSTVYGNKTA